MSEIRKLIAEKREEIREKMFDQKGYCFKELGCWLVDILLDNVHYEKEVQDLGFDISTHPRLTHQGFNLLEYETVEDFLNNELTGNTIATYMSGMGLIAETHYNNGLDYCFNLWSNFINKNFPEFKLVRDIDDEDAYDDIFEALCLENCGHYELYHEFGKMLLEDCYNNYLMETIDRRHKETLRQEKFDQQLEKIAEPALKEIKMFDTIKKIEAKNVNELLNFLDKVVSQHGYESVCAALKYHKFNCSLKVQSILYEKYPSPYFT